MQNLGRLLIVLGGVAVAAGVVFLIGARIPWLGQLPGDFLIERGRTRFYFPLATSIVLSIVLTILLNLFFRR